MTDSMGAQFFEREALLKWLDECHDVCPLTRKSVILNKDAIVNRALHQRIQEAWRKETRQEASMRETSDKKLPFLVSVKSTKTVIWALKEEPTIPSEGSPSKSSRKTNKR
jgi:hypothetical protein